MGGEVEATPSPAGSRRAYGGRLVGSCVPAVVVVHAVGLLVLYARPGTPRALDVVPRADLSGGRDDRPARRFAEVGAPMASRRQPLARTGYLALILVVLTLPVYDPYPSSHDERPSRVPFRVPFDEPVTVAWGGATADVNYHVFLPDQRWRMTWW